MTIIDQRRSDGGLVADNDGPQMIPARTARSRVPFGHDHWSTSQEIRDQGPATNPLVTPQHIQHCTITKSEADVTF